MILWDLGREEREEAYPRGRLSCREATIALAKHNSNTRAIFSAVRNTIDRNVSLSELLPKAATIPHNNFHHSGSVL